VPRCIGVCSWSLQPSGPHDLAEKVRAAGLSTVQLALDPIRAGTWSLDETVAACRDAGIAIRSGMMRTRGEDYTTLDTIRATGGVRPDEHWEANLAAARGDARLARELGLELVTFHAGFIPHERGDPVRRVMIDRLREIADVFDREGVQTGFETGQETAATLLDALDELDRPQVGVNFDPANMILYGMGDPVAALRSLAPRVVQIHMKDALPTQNPGTWGREVAAGAGAVDWPSFFEVYRAGNVDCDLMIEREAGGRRLDDIRAARGLIERLLAV
jgi:sugar phosphate isomerase/epimerase